MPRLKSPIGQASAAGLTRSPGATTARGAGYMTATIDPASIKALERALQSVDKGLRKRIAKEALRKWGRVTVKAAKGFAWRNAERTKRQLTLKVKSYKRAVWAGVGVKTEQIKTPRESRLGRHSPFVGWKSHFMEVGWHAFPKNYGGFGQGGNVARNEVRQKNLRIERGEAFTKQIIAYRNGKPHVRTIKERASKLSRDNQAAFGGRGWRRGVRGYKGTFQSQYARHYLFKAGMVGRSHLIAYLSQAAADAVRDAQKGRTA